MIDPTFSDEDIEEFRVIWKEEFGEWLEFGDARLKADRFLSAIYQIVTLSDRAKAREAQSDKAIEEFESPST